ncbi:hypothetical protein RRG08_026899, partial [Elysia crispata]
MLMVPLVFCQGVGQCGGRPVQERYSGSDRIMDQNEFTSYWLHFDRD